MNNAARSGETDGVGRDRNMSSGIPEIGADTGTYS